MGIPKSQTGEMSFLDHQKLLYEISFVIYSRRERRRAQDAIEAEAEHSGAPA